MPAARTGIIIAREEIIGAVSSVNAIINLATNSFGAILADDLWLPGKSMNFATGMYAPITRIKRKKALNELESTPVRYPFPYPQTRGGDVSMVFGWTACRFPAEITSG